jgi:hypothetical protein
MKTVSISGEQYTFSRLKLRKWIELSVLKERINVAVDTKSIVTLSDVICKFVSTATSISEEIIQEADWREIALVLVDCIDENEIDKSIPLFKYNEKQDEEPWEYPGRSWYVWLYKFSKEFGWTPEVVAELDVDDAFKLLQEMLVTDQLEREWQWSLSEKSSGYDEAAKKSKFIELPRPNWMMKEPKQPTVIKIPKAMLPVGNVIKYEPKKSNAAVRPSEGLSTG